jgi:hypothetical protein
VIWVVVTALALCAVLTALGMIVAKARAARTTPKGVDALRHQRLAVGAARIRTGLAGVVHGHLPHWS